MRICFYSECGADVPKGNRLFCSFEHQILNRHQIKRRARADARPVMICEYAGCGNKLGSRRRKFCCDEHSGAKVEMKLLFRNDNFIADERAACLLKKKKRDELLSRVCALSGCEKTLGTMRKKFCCDDHFTESRHIARSLKNPRRDCQICGVDFQPRFVKNIFCENPGCKRTGDREKQARYQAQKRERRSKESQSNYGSITRSYAPRPKKLFGRLATDYESKVEIDLLSKTDLRLSQQPDLIQAYLDSGKKIQKVNFERDAKSLEFEDMEQYEDPNDLSRFGNYSGSWDLTPLHN